MPSLGSCLEWRLLGFDLAEQWWDFELETMKVSWSEMPWLAIESVQSWAKKLEKPLWDFASEKLL